ncbi:IclR family transcriptional regulator [Arthrobacter yangruifuii]|uniref:IclR family transcriptional regulator n=1 Tax=Arthrobacter yangruifuii TaxID=2606616 RepID=UPI0011B7163D
MPWSKLDAVNALNDETAENTGRQSGGVQSIERAVAILGAFSRSRPIAGISEIARHTGLSRGTTHRLVSALTAHGMLTQVPNSTSYSLGPRLLSLAEVAREPLSLDVQSRPVMTWLRDQTGETVGLHVLDALPSRRTIAQVESLQPLRRIYTDLGAARPPHEGAPGKVLLAYSAPGVYDGVLAGLRASDTQEADRLDADIAVIRSVGYAISIQERVKGVVAIAAPVRDHRTQVVAALSISIPAVRAGRKELVALEPVLEEAASVLSARLGYIEEDPDVTGSR